MGIIAARIDNRLLHGIVAMQWTPEYRPQRIMVIDDEYASDPTKKECMRTAKPQDTALSIIARDVAYANFEAGKYDGHTVYLICRDPEIILHLINAGQKIPVMQLGGTITPEKDVPATQVSRRAFVLDTQKDTYAQILAAGTRIDTRYVPADKATPLESLIDLKGGDAQ